MGIYLGRSRMSLTAVFLMVWSFLELWDNSYIQEVVVVKSASGESLRDSSPGVGREPPEDFPEHS